MMDTYVAKTSFAPMENQQIVKMISITVPSQWKFLMNKMKVVINTELTVENHQFWRSQIIMLFAANGFDGYLDGSTKN